MTSFGIRIVILNLFILENRREKLPFCLDFVITFGDDGLETIFLGAGDVFQ